MNRISFKAAALALLLGASAFAREGVIYGPKKIDSPPMALLAGKVIPVTSDPIPDGVVLIRDSKILAVGPRDKVKIPPGFKVIEMPRALLFPGFIEAHEHMGSRTSRRMYDLNDMIQQINPGLRVLDFITTDHPEIKRARAGGVTTVIFIPGSGTNLSGWGVLMKTWGRTAREALVRFPGVLKVAQAGNPERPFGDLGSGRMGMNALLRHIYTEGRNYTKAWDDYESGKTRKKPAFDPSLELFRDLFHHKFPVCVHTQIYQPVLSTLRICGDEFGLWYYPTHSTFDAYKLAKEVKKRGVFINCGPRKYYFDRKTWEMVGFDREWWKVLGDDMLSSNTDAPIVPLEELPLQAAMASRLGLPPEVAIRGITINNARLLGVEKRMGSIEKGKDADLVFWTGDPLDPESHVLMTIVNGHIAYDPDRDGRLF